MSSVARRIVGLARESLSMERAMEQMAPLSRRRLLRALAATGAAALCRPQLASSQQARVLSKPIPSTGEELPAVGLGSWLMGDGDPGGVRERATAAVAAVGAARAARAPAPRS